MSPRFRKALESQASKQSPKLNRSVRWVKGSDVEAEIPGGTADALAAAAWADVVLLIL